MGFLSNLFYKIIEFFTEPIERQAERETFERQKTYKQPERQQVLEKETFYRHYISLVAYDNQRRQFYALTFTDHEVDLESELLNALADYLNEGYVLSSDYGYSLQEVSSMPFSFPEIETGSL